MHDASSYEYKPDRWVILKFTYSEETVYKILAGWGGGYLDGPSWRLNSGCIKVEDDYNFLIFRGYSRNIYRCHKAGYGTTVYTAQILNRLTSGFENKEVKIELMPENTNWLEINYVE